MSEAVPIPCQPQGEGAASDLTWEADTEVFSDPSWGYIENEGALFRGPSRHLPRIVWLLGKGPWAIYTGPYPARSFTWGTDITEAEAQILMSGDW